jgi:pimeloyl-ACP methyl ester carboxylesterase
MIQLSRLFLTGAMFIVLMMSMQSCMTFRMNKKEIDNYFSHQNIDGTQHHYKVGYRNINYIEAGDDSKPIVLFVHGSPGSLSAFIHFFADTSLTNKAQLLSTDRPGFGYSNFGNGVYSLTKQSDMLKPIIQKHKGSRKVILVGHSLGGPLIARMCMDYPELIDGLVIVAGSIDPALEPEDTWFRAPLASPFLSWILPPTFRSSNEELYHLKPELEMMLPLWQTIKCPVSIVHGKKDSLVPFENVEFARRMLINTSVDYYFDDEMDHFVPWSNPELIHAAILKMISKPVVDLQAQVGN